MSFWIDVIAFLILLVTDTSWTNCYIKNDTSLNSQNLWVAMIDFMTCTTCQQPRSFAWLCLHWKWFIHKCFASSTWLSLNCCLNVLTYACCGLLAKLSLQEITCHNLYAYSRRLSCEADMFRQPPESHFRVSMTSWWYVHIAIVCFEMSSQVYITILGDIFSDVCSCITIASNFHWLLCFAVCKASGFDDVRTRCEAKSVRFCNSRFRRCEQWTK